MTNAYSYIRMSSAEQLKGHSLERQLKASREYAAEHGLTLIEDVTFEDLGVSAYKGDNIGKNAALGKFVTAAEAKLFPIGSVLLVENLDRLSREMMMPAINLLTRIVVAGVDVVTISDGHVYKNNADPMGIMYAVMNLARAHDESEMKSKRLTAAWANKRVKAKTGTEKLSSKCPSWLTLTADRKSFIVDEAKADIVRLIFKKALEGKGANLITSELNASGLKPISGNGDIWSRMTVTNIIRLESVTGTYQHFKNIGGKLTKHGEPIEDYYPRIIDQDVYLRVQKERRDRYTGSNGKRFTGGGGNRGDNQSNLFTHIAKCGYCNGAIRFDNKGSDPKKGGVYLNCINFKNGTGCIAKGWKYADFEKTFLTFVRSLDLKSIIEGTNQANEIENSQTKLISLREQKTITMGKIKPYWQRLEDLPDQAEFINIRIAELAKESKEIDIQIKSTEDQLEALSHNGHNLDDAELQNYVDMIQNPKSGDRFVLANRIKNIITSIKLHSVGHDYRKAIELVQSSDVDQDDKDRVIAELMPKRQGNNGRYFSIQFKNGNVQMVQQSKTDDPDIIELSVMGGKDKYIESSYPKRLQLIDKLTASEGMTDDEWSEIADPHS